MNAVLFRDETKRMAREIDAELDELEEFYVTQQWAREVALVQLHRATTERDIAVLRTYTSLSAEYRQASDSLRRTHAALGLA